jgi:hypothetical protein
MYGSVVETVPWTGEKVESNREKGRKEKKKTWIMNATNETDYTNGRRGVWNYGSANRADERGKAKGEWDETNHEEKEKETNDGNHGDH